MAKGRRLAPRHGSLAFYPKKRVTRQYPTVRSVKQSDEIKVGSFIAYKAGMTHVMAIDNYDKSPSFGQTVALPVTILECPENKVVGFKAYTQYYGELKNFTTVYNEKLDKELGRKTTLPKKSSKADKIKKIQDNLSEITEIRLLVQTQPKKITLKKKPELVEVKFTKDNVEEQFTKAQELLGKEIKASDIFTEGEYLDTTSISTGKGTQGPMKRFNMKRQRHKAKGHVRMPGSIGAWHPARVLWTTLMTGQLGYQRRTELNKRILKITDNPEEVNPISGIRAYGKIKTQSILIKGSIAGPKKRAISIRTALRNNPDTPLPEIKIISKLAQNR